MHVLVTGKYKMKPQKNNRAKWRHHFPSTTLWELFVVMETRVLNQSAPTKCSLSPTPMMLLIKFDQNSGCWFLGYSSSKVLTHGLTDAPADAKAKDKPYTISYPCESSAQVSSVMNTTGFQVYFSNCCKLFATYNTCQFTSIHIRGTF